MNPTTPTTAPTTTPTTPTTTTPTTINSDEGPCNGVTKGHFPNPLDKGSYYNCGADGAHLQKCPKGLEFKQDLQRCDYPSPTTTTTTPTTINSGEGPCNGVTKGHFPNPLDKGSYYNCGADGAHLQKCPKGLEFKQDLQRCDYPSPTTTTTTPTTITSGEGPCNGVTKGHFANPLDKGSYYNCGADGAHLQKCPKGLEFKQDLQRCDYP